MSSAIMALLQYRAPVDYEAQQEAFRDFLEHFKSSQSKSEDAATDAIDDLNLEEDRTSDEYDFMDDVAEGDGRGSRRAGRSRPTKRKYMSILQEVADREKSSVLIELDDLEEVRLEIACFMRPDLISTVSMKKPLETTRI
jgi:DNA replication licensing factor MCM7